MIISESLIKDLKPCSDRFINFCKHNPNFTGSIEDFKKCNNISQEDLSWVFSRILNYQQLLDELTSDITNRIKGDDLITIKEILEENSIPTLIQKYSHHANLPSVLSKYLAQICIIKWHYSDKTVPIRDAYIAFYLKYKLIDELSQN